MMQGFFEGKENILILDHEDSGTNVEIYQNHRTV